MVDSSASRYDRQKRTPQSYMTPDPLMRNLAMEDWLLPDEESFYRWIEPVRDKVFRPR